MKFIIKVWFILGASICAVSKASLCDDCNLSCSWYDPWCNGKKATCVSAGSLFRDWITVVNAACGRSSLSSSDLTKLGAAKDLLVSRGILTRSAVDRVTYRFCNYIDVDGGTAGFTSSSGKVYFDDSLRTWSTERLAALMAHEVKHTQQYSRWGSNGFACRYSGQIARFNGFKCDNYVENEAYRFSDWARDVLGIGGHRGC